MKTNLRKISRIARSSYSLTIRSVILTVLTLTGIQLPIQAQLAPDTKHSWWFGVAAGANINFYRGTTQELNSTFISSNAFHNGSGVGLYLAPLVEFHRPGSRWGIMLQAGYDNREGKFKEEKAPCGCPVDLSTDLSYITVEPSLRFAPFKSNFYLFAGPRLAFNSNKSFIFTQGIHSDFINQDAHLEMNGDFSNINNTIISLQIGAGYDIPITSQKKQTQFIFSPFVSFQPDLGQSPRSIETWNVTTLRVGAALKFSYERKITASLKIVKPSPKMIGKLTPPLM
jgi:hypothetical protein